MFFKGLFRRKLSIKQGKKLLTEYCKLNGFTDSSSQWKNTTYDKHWFPYFKRTNVMVANNWVAYHPTRGNDKYSVWIDLMTEEIREVLRGPS
ncbi:hypothetical protein LGK95_10460 [Clostridium algoriphilum]|uniref:hypothetical protein n=1 Tax=Clostridium algoriphilum TaxID=198347 RepID=UPI001CF331A3|nr:hypothetical protein [Clostridium algoriphilum]MCB2293940.1 hypothetical protein [Clostridium algoriphilum]